ncbi:hypothetical protein GC194_00840 [bacterium]|nr:hypothetical protein [bacterium]
MNLCGHRVCCFRSPLLLLSLPPLGSFNYCFSVLKTKANRLLLLPIPFLVILLLWLGLQYYHAWLLLSLGAVLLFGYGVYRFNLYYSFALLLAFSLPLSVETEIFDGINMIIPTEFLTIIMAVALGFKVAFNFQAFMLELKQFLPLLFMCCMLVIGTLFSTQFFVSLKYSLVYLLYLITFFGLVYYLSRKQKQAFHYLISAYTVGILLSFYWSLYHWSSWDFNAVTIPKIFEPFYADHTIFAASSSFLFVYWLGKAIYSQQVRQRMLYILVLCVVAVAIRVSTSRAAFLSLPFAMVVFYMVKTGFKKRHLVYMLAALSGGLLFFQDRVVQAFQSNNYNSRDEYASLVERTASVTNVQTDVSNVERINRWVAALNMFAEKPLTGFGPGTFQFQYIPFQDARYKNRLTVEDAHHIPENSGGTVHSEPLLYLSELGIFGLLSWLILIFSWVHQVFSVPKAHRSAGLIIAFAMLSTYLFHGFFNNFLNTDKFAFLFWGTAGYLLSELKNAR